jgi:hypothetical protein
LLWNNATQTSATAILVSHKDDEGSDVELFLSFFLEGQKIFIQNRNDSSQNQIWEISGTPTVTGANTSTAYYTFPVTLVSSAGSPLTNGHSILFGTITQATNSVTSATTSDYTAELNLAQVNTGVLVVTDGVTIETLDYNFGTGSAQALKDALEIASTDITDFTTAVQAIAPDAVTSATTSDGTASLDISNLTLSQDVTSGLQTKMTFTANPTAVGDGQQIIWQWYNGGSPITTAAITTEAAGSTNDKLLFKTSYGGSVGTSLDLTYTLATFSGSISSLGESYRTSSTFTYGTGAAATHRTALGLTTLATTTPAANVATFLETPSSANLAAAVTDETGSGSLVFATSPSLTSPTIGTSATFNATTYTYGAGAALAHRTALGVGTRLSALMSNVNVTNTTTLQTVASLSVVAGKSYAVYGQIALSGTVNTGTRHGINFPASTYVRLTRKRASSYIPVEVVTNLDLGLPETTTLAELVGFITVTVSGTVNLLFAQNTASGDTTTCRTATFLTLTELV